MEWQQHGNNPFKASRQQRNAADPEWVGDAPNTQRSFEEGCFDSTGDAGEARCTPI